MYMKLNFLGQGTESSVQSLLEDKLYISKYDIKCYVWTLSSASA